MKEIGFSILGSLTFIIPQLIIVSACVYYLIKKISAEGFLLFFGSTVGLLSSIFHLIVMPYLRQKSIIDPLIGDIKIMTIIGPISFISSLAFSIGFLMLIYNTLSKKVKLDREIIDSNLAF